MIVPRLVKVGINMADPLEGGSEPLERIYTPVVEGVRPCPYCGVALGKYERKCADCRELLRPPRPVYSCKKCGGTRRHRGQSGLCVPCKIEHERTAYRHIRRASARVHGAVKSGKLPSPRTLVCADCGIPATEYDHRDYSKPLEVVPVCHSCNKKRGPGLRPAMACAA